ERRRRGVRAAQLRRAEPRVPAVPRQDAPARRAAPPAAGIDRGSLPALDRRDRARCRPDRSRAHRARAAPRPSGLQDPPGLLDSPPPVPPRTFGLDSGEIAMGKAVEELAHFVARTPWEAIPTAVQAHAKLVFLDTLGVILAGSAQPEVAGARARLT